jgi:acetylornithine deacetylase
MNATDTERKILDAVDAGFDAQLATTRDFVAIPSTRGAEGPCQDMIGDLLRQRGYEGRRLAYRSRRPQGSARLRPDRA